MEPGPPAPSQDCSISISLSLSLRCPTHAFPTLTSPSSFVVVGRVMWFSSRSGPTDHPTSARPAICPGAFALLKTASRQSHSHCWEGRLWLQAEEPFAFPLPLPCAPLPSERERERESNNTLSLREREGGGRELLQPRRRQPRAKTKKKFPMRRRGVRGLSPSSSLLPPSTHTEREPRPRERGAGGCAARKEGRKDDDDSTTTMYTFLVCAFIPLPSSTLLL